MYYAFYAEHFQGRLELRGLENKMYRIKNYENENDLGTLNGASPYLDTAFDGALLLIAEIL